MAIRRLHIPRLEMIGVDVLYDFPKYEGYTPVNFIVDPVDWAVVAYTGEDEFGEPYGKGRPQWENCLCGRSQSSLRQRQLCGRAYERVKAFITPGDGTDDKGSSRLGELSRMSTTNG